MEKAEIKIDIVSTLIPSSDGIIVATDVMSIYEVSRSSASRYLAELIKEEKVVKTMDEKKRATFSLPLPAVEEKPEPVKEEEKPETIPTVEKKTSQEENGSVNISAEPVKKVPCEMDTLSEETKNAAREKILEILYRTRRSAIEPGDEYINAETIRSMVPLKALPGTYMDVKTVWGFLKEFLRDGIISDRVVRQIKWYVITPEGSALYKKKEADALGTTRKEAIDPEPVVEEEKPEPEPEPELVVEEEPKPGKRKPVRKIIRDVPEPEKKSKRKAPKPGKKFGDTPPASKSTRKAPKPGKKKSTRYSRMNSFADALRLGCALPRTFETLCEDADALYAKNGGKPNMKETKWYGNIAYNLLVEMGTLIENLDGTFTLNK